MRSKAITRRQACRAGLLILPVLAAACRRDDTATHRFEHESVATPEARRTATASERANFSDFGWRTDFSRYSVDLREIHSGGPGKDGIPAIDVPMFLPLAGGDAFLKGREPVVAFEQRGDARAYPIQILMWHEIVNDIVGELPVVVTFCPLCNTAIAFDRRLDGRVLDFGTTGNLRHSDLVMYDRQTESWWQQVTGEAIVGELTGKRLTFLPAAIVSWDEFKATYPAGRVLSRETGFERDYGRNPYAGYDDVNSTPFLFRDKPDARLPPKERVVTVSFGGEDVAYPFSVLKTVRAVNDDVGGQPVVVFWQTGMLSALDHREIAASRDVGSAAVFDPVVHGRRLRFRAERDGFVDGETGSRWSMLGHAMSGPLAGTRLAPRVAGNHFWFAWAVFKPATRIYRGP